MATLRTADHLLIGARAAAGLSQQELADRAGTSQPAIARIESGRANPSLATLSRLVHAAGFELRLTIVPKVAADPVIEAYKRDVDRTLLRENLRRTIDERLRMNEAVRALGAELARTTGRTTSR